jgi:hypothetical protein
MSQVPWHILTRGVAAVLITVAVVIIFLMIEAYLEIGRELPVRRVGKTSVRHGESFTGRKAS